MDKTFGPFILTFAEHCAWRGAYLHFRPGKPEYARDIGKQIFRVVVDPTRSGGPTLSAALHFGNRRIFDFRVKLPSISWNLRGNLIQRFPKHEWRISRAYTASSMFWHNLDGRFRTCPTCGDRHMSVDCYACAAKGVRS